MNARRDSIVAVAMLAVAILAFPRTAAAAGTIRVVTTTEDLAAIAREVGGDRVKVESLCPGYRDPHFVDAKPSYMVQLRKADLFVEVGADLEVGWAPGLLRGARNARILPGAPGFVDASSAIEMIEVPASVSREQGDVHPLGNPHYWLDPANGARIAEAIRDGLSRVSPADAPGFAARTEAFEKKLATAIAGWKARAGRAHLEGARIVTYHRSWSYFARAFGLQVVDFVEPRPGIPPSPKHVQELVTEMKGGHVKMMIIESFFDPRLPQRIARDTGVPLVVMPTSVGGEDGVTTYFDLFDHIFTGIEKALAGGGR